MAQKIIIESELVDDVTGKSKSIGKSVGKDFDTMQKKGSDLTKSLGMVAKGFVGIAAAKGVLSFLKSTTQAANEQVLADTKLAAVMRATGNAAGFTIGELKKMASGFQKVTLFGDEVTQSAQAILLTFKGIGKEIFPEVVRLTQDMSTLFGQDLKASAIQLGKAFGDPLKGLTALSRVGINFSKVESDSIKSMVKHGEIAKAQGVILEALKGQVGGVAEAVAGKGLGPWQQMQNTLGDVSEEIGAQLFPMLNRLAEFMVSIAPTIQTVGGGLVRFVGIVGNSIGGIVQLVNTNVLLIVGGVTKAIGWMIGRVAAGLELLPAKFIPSGWMEGLRGAQAAMHNFGDNALGGAHLAAVDVVESLKAIKKGFTEVETATPDLSDILGGLGAGGGGGGGGGGADKKKSGGATDVKDNLSAIQDIRRQFQQIGKTDREKEAMELDNWYAGQAEALGNHYEGQLQLYEIFLERQKEMTAAFQEEDSAAREEHQQTVQGTFQEFSSGLISIARDVNQVRINNIERERKAEIQSVKSSSKTAKQKQDLISEINKKAEAEAKKAANTNKVIAIGEAIIGTALGITNAISTKPTALGIALAVLVGAMGAAQIAMIASQSFAHGGVVKGPREGDRVKVQANGGEMFLTMQQQARLLALAEGQVTGGGGDTTVHNTVHMPISGDISDDVWADRVSELKEALEELSFSGQTP